MPENVEITFGMGKMEKKVQGWGKKIRVGQVIGNTGVFFFWPMYTIFTP